MVVMQSFCIVELQNHIVIKTCSLMLMRKTLLTKILQGTLLATFSLVFPFRFCLFHQPSKEKYWSGVNGAYIKRQLKDKQATFSETHQSYFGINVKTYLAESGE